MMKRIPVYITALLVLFSSSTAAFESIKGREIIGFRIGSVFSTGALDTAFGKGSEMEFHFIEGLADWFGIAVSLSSHNFGDSKLPERSSLYVEEGETIELQIYSISAGFFACRNISDDFKVSAEAGPGLYAITLIKPGIFELSLNDYQPGLYTGAGLNYRLADSKICLNLSAKYHYIFSGTGIDHPIYVFTDRNRTGFFQICAGITLATGR